MCARACVCVRERERDRERTGMGSEGERDDARFKPDLQTFFASSGFGKSDIRKGIKTLVTLTHGTYATKIHAWSPPMPPFLRRSKIIFL